MYYLNFNLRKDIKFTFIIVFTLFMGAQTDAQNGKSIAIIGAGFAGISAYNKLRELGFQNVQVFEASNRVGGRVYPYKYGDIYLQHGAEFINGEDNFMYQLAKKHNVLSDLVNDDELFQMRDFNFGKCEVPIEKVAKFQEFFEKLEPKFLEMSKNQSLWNQSLAQIYNDEYKKFVKVNHYCFIMENYRMKMQQKLKKNCMKNYPTFTSLIMKANGRLHLINKKDGSEWSDEFDYVIVTVSLGHLKKYSQRMFHPSLPAKKLKAIEAFGFGVLQKIFLVYSEPFWDHNQTSLVLLNVDECSNVKNELANYLHTFEPHHWNKNILICWASGVGAAEVAKMSDTKLRDEITEYINEFLNPEIPIPKPTELIRLLISSNEINMFRHSWINNDLFLGSYSYITPEASNLDEDPIDLLNSPVDKKILFAGEATHNSIYQTTTGAYLSGIREAQRIYDYVNNI